MPELKSTPQEMLEVAYQELNYREGPLLPSTINPSDVSDSDWVEKGDWLALAHRIGADSIFFVNNDPVIVFFNVDNDDPEELRSVFLKAWSMARPQCLFIALPGEIKVYSLNRTPVREDEWSTMSPLAIATRVADVAEELKYYNREQVETGQVFAEVRFGTIDERADKRLIEDLKNVRRALIDSGLDDHYAHSLIGRSIFIRYLEDREILNREYFEGIANNKLGWSEILTDELEKPDLAPGKSSRFYYNVLKSKEFTYALFRKLAKDFNGDLFSIDIAEEAKVVTDSHLQLLRSFLLGEPVSGQQALFFWAYDFSVVPIDLISSIYEEFYHLGTNDDKGTHYTPTVLVEYVLSNLLTEEVLVEDPVILDPACGSGIFLVEAFRRIVRFKTKQKQTPLTPIELREILREQIRGIEIHREAIYIAAFSLYLALMHYQEPPAIQENPRLPKLIVDIDTHEAENIYHVLYNNNTFDLTDEERKFIVQELDLRRRFSGRVDFQRLLEEGGYLPLTSGSCDVIVGNPPWGFVGRDGNPEIKQAQDQARLWCEVFDWSIGDNELSQAFIARSLELLKQRGKAGLLVSNGILFKHHANSERFRTRWLDEVQLDKVVNFSHVRHLYFGGAISPFLFVQFQLTKPHIDHIVRYWSAKRTRNVNNSKSIVLGHTDLHRISQASLRDNPLLWKVYWWGNHNDAGFITALMLETTLKQIIDKMGWPQAHQGYTPGDRYESPVWLREMPELPIRFFRRYEKVNTDNFEAGPITVHRRHTNPDIFVGWRILVKRGITEAHGALGRIEARLESRKYAFRNSIHAVELDEASDEIRKILIGILWSSLARYFFFMTGRAWGFWHHEIHLEELLRLPVRLVGSKEVKSRIVQIVNQLQDTDYDLWGPFQSHALEKKIARLEGKLDEAIYELYELSDLEKDLIKDFCNYGLEFFYRHGDSEATSQIPNYPPTSAGVISDLNPVPSNGLSDYLTTFLQIWNSELEPDGEFRWRIVKPSHIPMIAVIFATQYKNHLIDRNENFSATEEEWKEILQRLDSALLQPVSKNIYIDGIVRAVTDTEIFIIKRDERRLWTRSIAREDAQATLLQAMHLQEAAKKGIE